MNNTATDRPFLRMMLLWAATIVVVAGMRAAASLVVPFLLAVFLAILCGPPLDWLMKRGLRRWLAMLLVLGGLCFVVLVLARVLVSTANGFVQAWPETYEPRARQIAEDWDRWISEISERHRWLRPLRLEPLPDTPPVETSDSSAAAVESLQEGSTAAAELAEQAVPELADRPLPSDEPQDEVGESWSGSRGVQVQWSDWIEPESLMQVFTQSMRAVSGILSQAVLILVTTVFLLMEASTLPSKMQAIAGDAPSRMDRLRQIADEVNQYMAIKTSTSLLTGGFITAVLWLLGVDFALLWGVTAFLLNFVPNIGSIIAAIPAVLLALLQHGFGVAAVVVGLYVAVNLFIGYFLEPRWMGRGLGLSTLVVFVSLVFWGWVLGPVGMVISVPLTMAVKIALEGSSETRWLAILMGPGGTQATSPAQLATLSTSTPPTSRNKPGDRVSQEST